jgi:large subunit ribosomal protein L6
VHEKVVVNLADGQITFGINEGDLKSWAHAGTARALVNNMVNGVTKGFERKLDLVGVGYRAKAGGKTLNLALGFSHPIDYELPEGITAETPTQARRRRRFALSVRPSRIKARASAIPTNAYFVKKPRKSRAK